MASRKIQVHRVEESSTPKGQISGLDNPALDNQDTVRSMAELMCNESPMAQDEVPPSPSVPVPSIPPPPPEKVNGALPRVETIEEEDEEELDIEEEARRMGVDAREIAMIASRGSIRRMSSVSKISYIEKTKKKYPLKITVTTGVLFIIMVIGVSLIFHFYHKQLYLLEIGAQIKFDEITRHIDFRGEDEVIKMSGNLGLEIPSEVKFLDCSTDNTRKTHLCLTWKGHAQLWIDYSNHDNVDCYKIAWWGKKYDTILKDCYEIGDASWYGGGFLSKKQMWTLNNISIPETLFVTGSDEKSGQLGSVLARYWLNSNAISIFAPSYYPLFFSFNELDNKTEQGNGKFCLVSHSLDRFGGQRRKEYPEMNYTVCVSNDINSVQTYSLNKTLRDQNKTPRNLPNEKLFKNTVWSTKKLSNLSEESLIQFGSDITANNYSHGFLILNSKWEKYLGDLNFNAQIFPGASAMLRSLQSNFTLSLSLTPYIDTRSEAFQHDIHDKLLIEDAGGVAPGLIEYLNPMFNQSLIAGVIKVESPYFHAKLREIKNFYNIESIVLKGGDVRTLPFGADHGAHLESNMNWFTQKYSDAVNGTYSTLFVESASQTQWLLPIVVMPSLPSTWDGLRTVLPRMFTLGIIGYPLVLPEVVGGSINDADEYQPSKELYIRWLELSAFLPVMHFSDFPHSYDSTTTQISRKFVQFHSEQIAPLVLRLAQQSVSRLEPIIRPLWRIAPQDKEIFTIEDQFLVGDEMLVAPVLDNTKQRNIYLPEGSWFDKLKNKFYTGPRWLRDYNVELDEVAYFMWQSQ